MTTVERVNRYRIDHLTNGSELNAQLLKTIGFQQLIEKLGLDLKQSCEDEYVGYCPDHFHFTGRQPSHPKWYVNSETGATYCMTEGRGSNILETAKRMLGLNSAREAFDKLTDGAVLSNLFIPKRQEVAEEEKPDNFEKLEESLKYAEPFLDKGELSKACLAFFQKDGIEEDTLKRYGVCSCSYGKYKDRALIPFISSERKISGFVAVDLLGKTEWCRRFAEYVKSTDASIDEKEIEQLSAKKYRKAIYAPGFQGRHHLYGMYENFNFMEDLPDTLVLVEGERDCLKLMQEGIPCLAIHGTFLKDEQRLLMKQGGIFRNLKHLYMGFDMDEPGRKACFKVAELLASEVDADKIRILHFPDGKDPKKFCRKELLDILEASTPAF